MKNQFSCQKMRRLLALFTAISIISGVLAVFPALAASVVDLSQVNSSALQDGVDALSEDETLIGKAYPGYVVFDADYINANLIKESGHGAKVGGVVENDKYKSVRLAAMSIDGQHHSDPYITLNMNDMYDADAYKYLTVIACADSAKRGTEGKSFEIFFDTDGDTSDGYTASKFLSQGYATVKGLQTFTYDFSDHKEWKGKIKHIRLDFFSSSEKDLGNGDYCDIAAVILSKTPDYAYDSAYDFLKNVYSPKQVLEDFGEDSLKHFISTLSATTASISNGNLLVTSAPKSNDNYEDPWAAFMYRDYMIDIGRKKDILKTSDFSYTAIKFRTSPNIPKVNKGQTTMQLFVYTNDEKLPIAREQVKEQFLSPAVTYTPSDNYNWQTAIFNMDSATLLDNPLTPASGDQVSRWTYTENFNGFRFDWCSNGAKDAFLEVDEIMFFESKSDAQAFSVAVNTIKLPTKYPSDNSDGGEIFVPEAKIEGCIEMDAYGIDEILDCPQGIISTTFTSEDEWTGIRLSAAKDTDDPYVLLKTNDLKLDMYPSLTFIIRRNGISADKPMSLVVYYKTADMLDYDEKHVAKAAYQNTDSWQIISMDMSNMPDLLSDVTELKLKFLADADDFEDEAGCEIFAIAACQSNATALEYARAALLDIYAPEQIVGSFGVGDEGYFVSNGKTDVSYVKANGGIKLTLTEDENDPSVNIFYRQFMLDSDKYIGLTTDEFNCVVFNLGAQVASGSGHMQLSLLGANKQPTSADTSSSKVSYANGLARSVALDMMSGENANGWFGSVDHLRLVWNGEGKAGDTLEISDIILFKDGEDAQKYCEALNTFQVTVCTEPNENTDETLPEIGSESESESNVEGTENTEETSTTENESNSEEENSDNTPMNPPTNFDPNAGSPQGETPRAEGSKVPFVIACISLSGLSGASIVTVIVIRIRLKSIV